ncbi:MAG: tetratricopeptide repeat protein [Xanthomonadales bacterium]|nr:tetratricopeptide repeat protein [Xanthomonadales bacterium]
MADVTLAALRSAWSALSAGRAEQALALLQPVLESHPDHPDALQIQAGAALALGRAGLAVDALQRVQARRPDDPGVNYNLGLALRAAGQPAAAIEAFARSVQRQPAPSEPWIGLAQAAGEAGRPLEAAKAWQAVLARRPHDLEAASARVRALADAGHAADALIEARALVGRQPGRTEPWQALAWACEVAGDVAGAEAALQEGVAAGADRYVLALARGHLAWRRRAWLAAATAFADAAALRADGHEAWTNLAASQIHLDRIDEAIASAGTAVALAPDAVPARMTLAAALSRGTAPDQVERALAASRALIADHPGLGAAHDCLAACLLKQGNAQAALQPAREAVRLAPDEAGPTVTLARVLEALGRLDEAEQCLQLLAQAEDAPAPVLRQLGQVRLRSQQSAPALVALDRACRLEPADQGGIAARAIALAGVEGWPAAEAWLGLHDWVREVDIATPPAFADRDAFLAALADDIRNHSRLRYEPVGLVARGGWLTGELLADDTPAITGFADSLRAAIAAFIAGLPDVPGHPFLGQVPRGPHLMHVWATRVREQGLIDTHIHEGSWLSGAFYVALPPVLGDGSAAGWIEFGQPYPGLPAPPPDRLLRLRPRPGAMLFFPSYLFHRTLPYSGEGERISISFDLGPAA